MNNPDQDIDAYLPAGIVPAWEFLLENPVLLAVLFAAIGYLVGKLLQVDRRFRQEGITIPYPRRDVHIKENQAPEIPGTTPESAARTGS